MSETRVMLHTIQSIYYLMQSGKLVIPAFQRSFAWSKSAVRNLLSSIYQGYPIGTFLVLEDQVGRYPTMDSRRALFPIVDQDQANNHTNVWYIIDGSQRLVALYNTLFGQEDEFQFWFELETEEFVSAKVQDNQRYINLRSLYSSDEFRDMMVNIAKTDESGVLFDRLNRLHTAFKDYHVIIQVLIDASLDDAIEIFERLNTSGLALSKAELERIRSEYGKS